MSKTRRNYQEEYYDDEEYNIDIDDYRQHRKEKRLVKALRARDLEDLMHLEDDEY
jgi:hypothetical protein